MSNDYCVIDSDVRKGKERDGSEEVSKYKEYQVSHIHVHACICTCTNVGMSICTERENKREREREREGEGGREREKKEEETDQPVRDLFQPRIQARTLC